VALRLIVEREREIEAFVPVEYWSIHAELQPEGIKSTFIAKLAKVDEKDPELPNEETVKPILVDMETAAYVVTKVKRGERRRKPLAPFTTSTLQQEASRKLGFTAKRTMALAQGLYEGQDVGNGGATGLITYMRRIDQLRAPNRRAITPASTAPTFAPSRRNTRLFTNA
jgi:DNA topoisomerase-1